VAQAALEQAQAETIYAVTYSYLAAIYAAQQKLVADDYRILYLDYLRTKVKELEKREDIWEEYNDLLDSHADVVEARRQEAVQGHDRALAALREAMGVGPDFPVRVPDRTLPCPKVDLNKDDMVALALARRSELVQATTAEHIVGLEVDAQGAICRPSARTFAAGSDLHARALQAGSYGPDYRPGAIGIEMPTLLAGHKQDRREQAEQYHARAEAVVAKTQQLIALEAQDAVLRWQDRSVRAANLAKAVAKNRAYSERLRRRWERGEKPFPSLGEVMNAGAITTRLRIDELEAQFQSLIALAALERITSGGFVVDLDAPCK
jgi:outer membrane protein TolC